MKSKKALARLAQQEAEAQAKLDLVETYKGHFRTMLGLTVDDLVPLADTVASEPPVISVGQQTGRVFRGGTLSQAIERFEAMYPPYDMSFLEHATGQARTLPPQYVP